MLLVFNRMSYTVSHRTYLLINLIEVLSIYLQILKFSHKKEVNRAS